MPQSSTTTPRPPPSKPPRSCFINLTTLLAFIKPLQNNNTAYALPPAPPSQNEGVGQDDDGDDEHVQTAEREATRQRMRAWCTQLRRERDEQRQRERDDASLREFRGYEAELEKGVESIGVGVGAGSSSGSSGSTTWGDVTRTALGSVVDGKSVVGTVAAASPDTSTAAGLPAAVLPTATPPITTLPPPTTSPTPIYQGCLLSAGSDIGHTRTTTTSTSWEPRVQGVDGWDLGWEDATQMVVKRKGRGGFLCEEESMVGEEGGLTSGVGNRQREKCLECEDRKRCGVV